MNPENPYQPGQQYPPAQPPMGSAPQGQPVPQPGYGPAPVASMYTPPAPHKPSKIWVVLTFVFLFTTIAAAGAGTWALINYFDQKNNVDAKVADAVSLAVKNQSDLDAAEYLEKEKQPNRQFAGPDDYGRLSFDYPKTWGVYEAQDGTNRGTYEAYFNPGVVPPVSDDRQYALRVTIDSIDYDEVVDDYSSFVEEGDLTSSTVKIGGQTGTRLDGSFSEDIRGSAVIFKIRDKTVTIRSDAQTFKADFDALIKTINFNK